MIVFKTFLKILNKNKFIIILFTVMLLVFSATNMSTSDNNVMFESNKPKIAIINEDKDSDITNNLVEYMDSVSKIQDIKEDIIDDALFNRQIHYVIYIPKNYGKEFLEGKNPQLKIKKTGTYNSELSEMELKRYINIANNYQSSTKDEKELIEKINNTLSNKVDVELTAKVDTDNLSRASFYYTFASYSILASLVYIICLILSNFRDEKIRKRTIISSINYKKLNRQLLLSNLVFAFSICLIYIIFSFILVGKIMFTISGLIYMLNMLIYTICATTIAFLIGNILKSKGAISGIVNVVALGSSFLCGVFVPMSMLPKPVYIVSHILPTYYYVNTNDLLATMETFNLVTLKPIIFNMIMILVFSIIFSILSNVIYNVKRKLD